MITTDFKPKPQVYTLEFAQQRYQHQIEYVAELDKKNCRDEVWESAMRTMEMWHDEVKKLEVKAKYNLN